MLTQMFRKLQRACFVCRSISSMTGSLNWLIPHNQAPGCHTIVKSIWCDQSANLLPCKCHISYLGSCVRLSPVLIRALMGIRGALVPIGMTSSAQQLDDCSGKWSTAQCEAQRCYIFYRYERFGIISYVRLSLFHFNSIINSLEGNWDCRNVNCHAIWVRCKGV